MTDSFDDDRMGQRRPPKNRRRKNGQRANLRRSRTRAKAPANQLEVVERLLMKPIDTVKDGEPTKMSTLQAILYQLLQKSLSGNKKAERALQLFEDFAHRSTAPDIKIVFVDNDYTRALAASKEDEDVKL